MTAFAGQHLRVDIDMQRAKWLMVSVLYPGYRKPAMNGDAMSESFKLSHRWERKMEMEGLAPSGLLARR